LKTPVPLPNSVYIDQSSFLRERETVLGTEWVAIGFSTDIAEPGDIKPVALSGMPLFLLRNQKSEILVFHNVCSHRGVALVTEPGKVRNVLRCPYHSWAYDLKGNLVSTPHIGGQDIGHVDGFDKAVHGLKKVRSAEWMGVVFVNLDGKAPELADHIKPLISQWHAFDLDAFVAIPETRSSLDIGANWKLVVDNYLESYHLPWVHPELNKISKLEDHYCYIEQGYSGQGTTVYQGQQGDTAGLPSMEVPPEWQKRGEYPVLYPNTFFGIHHDHFYAIWLEPIGPGATREHWQIYGVGEGADKNKHGDTHLALRDLWNSVFLEDVGVVEAMQIGRQSPAFSGGVLTPVMETTTRHFHDWVAERLT